MVETEFGLGGLEAVLDGPAMTLDADQGLDGGLGRTPGGEEGQVAVGDVTADQMSKATSMTTIRAQNQRLEAPSRAP